jgi:predicted nucleic acid-binding protein
MSPLQTYLIDTNVLLRLLTAEPPSMAEAARVLFDRAARREIGLVIMPTVLAESCFVLTGPLKIERRDAAEALALALSLPGVEDRESRVMRRALELVSAHGKLHFVDAYLFASAEAEAIAVASFDRPAARIAGQRFYNPLTDVASD